MVRMKKVARAVGDIGDASASLVRRGRPRKTEEELLAAESRRPKRLFELSITISVGGVDVDTGLLLVLKEFLGKETIAGMCSVERGGTVFHLHFCRPLGSHLTKGVEWSNGKLLLYGSAWHFLARLRTTTYSTFLYSKVPLTPVWIGS
ncbi:hypothetical protein GOP47_0008113 [Adiantum capillus-veneris]|uniref:Uncharacterized protein n=1 Tax=Adiantum capillus-veneris TaxID=13818 RepID=A0A9D4UXX6_ADICA|nr:hypothetical protein GOP47_0008113 [Adiantum capillus-veneris]